MEGRGGWQILRGLGGGVKGIHRYYINSNHNILKG